MTINVNNASTLTNVEGARTHHCCKPVINKTTGVVYASALDAAEALGCHPVTVSECCRGKLHSCKGNKLEYVKHTSENVDSLTAEIRALHAKIAAMEADAAVGRAVREEQEAKQRAEEERLNTIALLKENIAAETKKKTKRQAIVERIEAELQKAVSRLMTTENKIHEAEMQLLELEGKVKA